MKYFFRACGGGLGDFMCNYASMKSLSLDYNRDFYLYDYNNYIDWNHSKCQYIKRNTTGWTELFKDSYRFVDDIKPEHVGKYYTVHLPFYKVAHMDFGGMDYVHIDGFPFTNSFFEHRLPEIIDSINLPNYISPLFLENEVVLNTRRGEYPSASPEFIDLCKTNYYINVLKKIDPSKVTIVSDDIKWTVEWYKSMIQPELPNASLAVYDALPIHQFEFMMKAPNLIICQSQFSRWAGILNKNNVYSPYKWYKTLDKAPDWYNLSNWNKVEYDL